MAFLLLYTVVVAKEQDSCTRPVVGLDRDRPALGVYTDKWNDR